MRLSSGLEVGHAMLSGAGVLSGFRPKGPAEHSGGLRGLKAVTDTQGITVRKPPVTMQESLTRALRRGHIRPF
jgi:hypothetical protein